MFDLVPSNGAADAVRSFTFDDRSIRVVMMEGAPWFVAADTLRTLNFDTSRGASKYLTSLRV